MLWQYMKLWLALLVGINQQIFMLLWVDRKLCNMHAETYKWKIDVQKQIRSILNSGSATMFQSIVCILSFEW